jgi:GTPase SAR1 family protein
MKKNIVFIGANGSGKTTLSQMFYKQGYHMLKLSPLSDDNQVYLMLSLYPNGIVFDRWSPIDLVVHRKETDLFDSLVPCIKALNDSNIIIYLENLHSYDDSHDTQRVVQRPNKEELDNIRDSYRRNVIKLINHGLKVFWVPVRLDANETKELIERIVRENA